MRWDAERLITRANVDRRVDLGGLVARLMKEQTPLWVMHADLSRQLVPSWTTCTELDELINQERATWHFAMAIINIDNKVEAGEPEPGAPIDAQH